MARHRFNLTAYDADAVDLAEEIMTGTFDEALDTADKLAREIHATVEVAVTTTLNYNKDR